MAALRGRAAALAFLARLEAWLYGAPCAICGRKFKATRRTTYCSPGCAAHGRRVKDRAARRALKERRGRARGSRMRTVYVKRCKKCGAEFRTARLSQVFCHGKTCRPPRPCTRCGAPVRPGNVFCCQLCANEAAGERSTRHLPDEAEIAAVCEQIREAWPPGEEAKRVRPDWLPVPWVPPSSTPAPTLSEALA